MSSFDMNRLVVPDDDFSVGVSVPTLDDAVEGWRAWRVLRKLPRYGNPVRLESVSMANTAWVGRRVAQAVCPHGGGRGNGHRVPDENCSCGFYSAKDLKHLVSMRYHRTMYSAAEQRWVGVIGQVANWGKVIEGTQGWRAEFCYPIRLWVPFDAAELAIPLREQYGCQVRLGNILNGNIDQTERS